MNEGSFNTAFVSSFEGFIHNTSSNGWSYNFDSSYLESNSISITIDDVKIDWQKALEEAKSKKIIWSNK